VERIERLLREVVPRAPLDPRQPSSDRWTKIRRADGAGKMHAWTSERNCRAYSHCSVVPARYVSREFGPEGLTKVFFILVFLSPWNPTIVSCMPDMFRANSALGGSLRCVGVGGGGVLLPKNDPDKQLHACTHDARDTHPLHTHTHTHTHRWLLILGRRMTAAAPTSGMAEGIR
jgi:hypothetical protein